MKNVERAALVALAVVAAVLAGCQGTKALLREPPSVPSYAQTYRSDMLRAKMRDCPTVLSLSSCADRVTVTEDGLFGVRAAGTVSVRPVVEREFKKVLTGNFRICYPGETPRLALDVRSEQIDICRQGQETKCTMRLAICLMTVVDGRRQERFVRRYVRTTSSPSGAGVAPNCLYEAVQRMAEEFVADLSKAYEKTPSRHG